MQSKWSKQHSRNSKCQQRFYRRKPQKATFIPNYITKLEQDEKNTGNGEKEEGKNDTEEGTIDI